MYGVEVSATVVAILRHLYRGFRVELCGTSLIFLRTNNFGLVAETLTLDIVVRVS